MIHAFRILDMKTFRTLDKKNIKRMRPPCIVPQRKETLRASGELCVCPLRKSNTALLCRNFAALYRTPPREARRSRDGVFS